MGNPASDSTCATRLDLLKAALACFAENGFDGTSMRMIADRAQRPLSLLSHHFGNKEGLYLEIFKFLFETRFRKKQEKPIPEDGYTPRDRSEAIRLLREQIHFIFMDVSLECCGGEASLHEYGTRLWLQEIHSPRPSLYPLLIEHMRPVTETTRKCIQLLRPDLGEEEVVFLGISILGQVTCHGLMYGMNQVVWGKTPRPCTLFQGGERLVDLCLNGILGGQPIES